MSILIKGLKMPRWCNECKYHYWRDSLCEITNKEVDDDASMRGVQPWCPITEIPDHGDLIDRETLMSEIADWQLSESPEEGRNWWRGKDVTSHEMQYGIYRLLGDVYEEVRDMPVVIPAERSE